MIREFRILFEPADIAHVRLHCKHCQQGIALYSLTDDHTPPRRCPSCGVEWWPAQADYPSLVPELALIWALKALCKQERPVHLRLESPETNPSRVSRETG